MMHNSDEIMNSALFIFMGLVARQLAQKQLQMKLWFTWEMKISIKIYFLVILWSVKFFVKQRKCVGMTFQNENEFGQHLSDEAIASIENVLCNQNVTSKL